MVSIRRREVRTLRETTRLVTKMAEVRKLQVRVVTVQIRHAQQVRLLLEPKTKGEHAWSIVGMRPEMLEALHDLFLDVEQARSLLKEAHKLLVVKHRRNLSDKPSYIVQAGNIIIKLDLAVLEECSFRRHVRTQPPHLSIPDAAAELGQKVRDIGISLNQDPLDTALPARLQALLRETYKFITRRVVLRAPLMPGPLPEPLSRASSSSSDPSPGSSARRQRRRRRRRRRHHHD